jgi:hypothetical protein
MGVAQGRAHTYPGCVEWCDGEPGNCSACAAVQTCTTCGLNEATHFEVTMCPGYRLSEEEIARIDAALEKWEEIRVARWRAERAT